MGSMRDRSSRRKSQQIPTQIEPFDDPSPKQGTSRKAIQRMAKCTAGELTRARIWKTPRRVMPGVPFIMDPRRRGPKRLITPQLERWRASAPAKTGGTVGRWRVDARSKRGDVDRRHAAQAARPRRRFSRDRCRYACRRLQQCRLGDRTRRVDHPRRACTPRRGVILVDALGRIGWATNDAHMRVAWQCSATPEIASVAPGRYDFRQ